jgi:hypothetical protein
LFKSILQQHPSALLKFLETTHAMAQAQLRPTSAYSIFCPLGMVPNVALLVTVDRGQHELLLIH